MTSVWLDNSPKNPWCLFRKAARTPIQIHIWKFTVARWFQLYYLTWASSYLLWRRQDRDLMIIIILGIITISVIVIRIICILQMREMRLSGTKRPVQGHGVEWQSENRKPTLFTSSPELFVCYHPPLWMPWLHTYFFPGVFQKCQPRCLGDWGVIRGSTGVGVQGVGIWGWTRLRKHVQGGVWVLTSCVTGHELVSQELLGLQVVGSGQVHGDQDAGVGVGWVGHRALHKHL